MAKAGEKLSVPAKQTETTMTMRDWINKSEKQIAKALPSAITPERFARMAMTAVTMNPDLGKCTPPSFIGAMLQAASLGLEPNTPLGQAYLIPYNNYKSGEKEAQFQIGYRGLIELAHRSGEFKSIEAHIVYENDEFEYELGLEPKLRHKPAMKNRGEIVWVYAVYKLQSGGYGFEVMSKDDINEHRKKYSKARTSPWDTAWEGMAKKTVIKQALKYAPLKSEFVRAMTNEDVTLNFRDDVAEDVPVVLADEATRYDDEAIDVEPEVVKEESK
jgi:recombination protein RecT